VNIQLYAWGGENLHSTIFKEKILGNQEKKNPKPIFFYRPKPSPSLPLIFFENKANPPFPWKKTKTDAPAFRPSPSSSSLTCYSPQTPGHKPLFPCLSRLRASGHHLLISLYRLQPLRQTSLPQPATIVNTIYRPSLSVNTAHTAPPETALHSFFFPSTQPRAPDNIQNQMEPAEATPFLSRSSRISRSHPSLPVLTLETEEKFRPASGPPFPVSSATAPETSSDNSRQAWLHREQRAGASFVSNNQSSSSTSPPAAASPGKSFFPCSCFAFTKAFGHCAKVN